MRADPPADLADDVDVDADDPPHAALSLIIAGPSAWSGEAELVAAGVTPEALADLAAAGMVAPWDLPDGSRAWTLTPLTAERLGVEIVESEYAEEPRWRPIGRPPRPLRMPRHSGQVPFLTGEQFAAPREGPIEELMKDIDDEPVILFGRTVVIDPRMIKETPAPKPKRKGGKGRTGRKGGKSRAKTQAAGKARKASKAKTKQAKALG